MVDTRDFDKTNLSFSNREFRNKNRKVVSAQKETSDVEQG